MVGLACFSSTLAVTLLALHQPGDLVLRTYFCTAACLLPVSSWPGFSVYFPGDQEAVPFPCAIETYSVGTCPAGPLQVPKLVRENVAGIAGVVLMILLEQIGCN